MDEGTPDGTGDPAGGWVGAVHREKRPKINFDLLVDMDFNMIYRSANPAIIP